MDPNSEYRNILGPRLEEDHIFLEIEDAHIFLKMKTTSLF